MSQIISAFLPLCFLLSSVLLALVALGLAVSSHRHEITSNSPLLKKMCASYEHRSIVPGQVRTTTDMRDQSKIVFSESSASLTKSSAKSSDSDEITHA
jgi:hypothetical protein